MQRRSSKRTSFPLAALGLVLACSSAENGPASGDGDGDGAGVVGTGGALDGSTGGGSVSPGDTGGGAALGTGGLDGSSGGSTAAPVDCSLIEAAGYDVCETSAGSCGAVFTDGSGCGAVCAAAGLECEGAYENVDGACAANMELPGVACESGHQSDFCVCSRSGHAGSGGAPGTGAADGSGGTTGSGETDCNSIGDRPVVHVNENGSGDFTKVQSAIDSISASNSTPTIIRIAPGEYYEKLEVDRPNITLCGQVGQVESTILTYSDGADTAGGTTNSRSVYISADDVSAENITFENTRGVGSQAVALLVNADRVQFRDSRFIGHQDTLYVRGGRHYFRDSYVEGTVDYIFGDATAVFDDCTIHTLSGGSAVTAPSTPEEQEFGLVFLGGTLTAAGGVSGQALGRNWHPYGSATYIETELGSHISGVGWVKMGDNSLSTARFSEYQSTGPGANPGARAPESSQLSAGQAASFTVDNIFGNWTPTYSE